MSVDRDKGKEKVVHEDEEPHNELAKFIIDFVSAPNPIVALKFFINNIGIKLSQLALTQPQTLALEDMTDRLVSLICTYTVSLDVVFNY